MPGTVPQTAEAYDAVCLAALLPESEKYSKWDETSKHVEKGETIHG